MKPSTVPLICGTALAVMSAAAASHWWSVKTFVTAIHSGLPISQPVQSAPTPVEIPTPKPAAPKLLAKAAKATPAVTDASQKEFYEALIAKMENLQNQNRDLLDQVAETNRDMMNLNFRVDTFSDSFRPLPVSEERSDTSFDSGPGVLPPRAEPAFLPYE